MPYNVAGAPWNASDQAAPARFDLLRSAMPLDPGGTIRWQGGLSWVPEQCDLAASIISGLCWVGSAGAVQSEDKIPARPPGPGLAMPVLVHFAETCSGPWGDADAEARARRGWAASLSKALEQQVIDGTVADASDWGTPHFGDGNTVDLTVTAVEPRAALALLENSLLQGILRERGIILAPPALITCWDSMQLLRVVGGRLETLQGNVVAQVTGVDLLGGNPPAATAYATSMLYAARTAEPLILNDLDRATNDKIVVAEGEAIIAGDWCIQVSADADLTIV